MTTETSTRIWSDHASHPGELLGEELEARCLERAAFAIEIGESPEALGGVIAGESPITASLAIKIEATLGIDAVFWMGLQTTYDLTVARIARTAAAALPQ